MEAWIDHALSLNSKVRCIVYTWVGNNHVPGIYMICDRRNAPDILAKLRLSGGYTR